VVNAFSISAWTKSPLNWLSFVSQKSKPVWSVSWASSGSLPQVAEELHKHEGTIGLALLQKAVISHLPHYQGALRCVIRKS